MRLDRLLTLGLFQPLQQLAVRGRSVRLPILMYHSISNGAEFSVAPYYQVRTKPERFAEQMQWLAEMGYRAVTLREGLDWLDRKNEVPDHEPNMTKLVVVTFDDGFQDFHTVAYPVLHRFGFAATMYLPTAFISEQRKTFKGITCMTWREVRELAAAGIEFGSHTVNHPQLVKLAWPNIDTELRDSKSAIEQHLGEPVLSFAYPYAFPQENQRFANRFRIALESAAYVSCVTTGIGRAVTSTNRHDLPRLPANSADDHALFLAKIAGAYDWLSFPQALVKQCKHLIDRKYFK